MPQSTAMLGLLTETSLHAGTGQMLSEIDLPIQREAHTDWPCVYGSAVKGAMRELAENNGHKTTWVDEVFGPDMAQNASEHAGALSISDARLLLLPVRSLTGYFKWVTCPALLHRLQADYRRLGLPEIQNLSFSDYQFSDNQALISKSQNEGDLFLEEFRFQAKSDERINDLINSIIKLMGRDKGQPLHLQLVIVNSGMFAHLARYATPVNAHIAIDNDTKTVKRGALWYEETLPPDTLLYTMLVAQKSRKKDSQKKADDILGHIINELFSKHPYLQLGGNQTVGMGWCRVNVLRELRQEKK